MSHKTIACLVSIMFVASAAVGEEAAQLSLYTVQAGDSCASVARKLFGDPRRVNLIHENNDLGASPHHLKEGQILKVPLPGPQGPDALVTFVRNIVEKYNPERAVARSNDELFRGNRVNTLSSSSAELTFSDKTQLQLGSDTLIVILGENSGKTARQATAADTTLLSGALRAHLSDLAGAPRTIATPAGQVRLEKGDSQISVDGVKATRLAVYQGRSRLRASGTEVAVPAGYGSKAEKGLAPTKPRPLPPAPIWNPLPSSLLLTLEDAATFEASYRTNEEQGPKAAAWHLQLARDERFNDLVFDKQVLAAVLRMQARRLPAGRYFVRVSAIDDDHFEGAFGPTLSLQVALAKATRTSVEVSDDYQCSIDGAESSVGGRIDLDRAAEHRLKCSARKDETILGELMVPRVPRSLVVRGSLDRVDSRAGHGRLIINVATIEGKPAKGRRILISGNATTTSFAELDQPGLYVAELRWEPGTKSLRLRLQVEGTDVAENVTLPVTPGATAGTQELRAP